MAKRKTKSTGGSVGPTPSIVTLAGEIDATERAIGENVTRNVQIQMQLNKTVAEEQRLRQQLAGLHREMDKHTSSTRVR
jgi:hypothetical protein